MILKEKESGRKGRRERRGRWQSSKKEKGRGKKKKERCMNGRREGKGREDERK